MWQVSVLLLLLAAVYLLIKNNSGEPSTGVQAGAQAPKRVAHLGETVKVGYWTYRINGAEWTPYLGYEFMSERADAQFLVLDVTARNDDRTESTLPPIKLLNDAGQEFSETGAGSLSRGFFGLLKSLNPTVTSRGLVAFDVPPGKYRVLLPGGFRSEKAVEVDLSRQTVQPTARDSDQAEKQPRTAAPAASTQTCAINKLTRGMSFSTVKNTVGDLPMSRFGNSGEGSIYYVGNDSCRAFVTFGPDHKVVNLAHAEPGVATAEAESEPNAEP